MNEGQVLKYSCYRMHMQIQHSIKEQEIQIVDIKENRVVCIIPLNGCELSQKRFDPEKYYISMILQSKNELYYIVFDAYLRIIIYQVKLDNKKIVFFALHQNCLITHEKGAESFYMYTYLDKYVRCYKLKCNKTYFTQSYYETKQIIHQNRIVVQIINQGLSYIFDTNQVYQDKGGFKYIKPSTGDSISEEPNKTDYDFQQAETIEGDSFVNMSVSNTLQSYDSSLENKSNDDAISNSKLYMKDFIFQQNGQKLMFGFSDIKKTLTIQQVENKKVQLIFNQQIDIINNFQQLSDNLLLRCGNFFSKVNFDTQTYEIVAELSRNNYQNFKLYNKQIYAFDQYQIYKQDSYSEMKALYSLDKHKHAHIRDVAFFGDVNYAILTKTHLVLVINNDEISIDIGRMMSYKFKDLYNLTKICVNHNLLYVKNQNKQVFVVKNFNNIFMIQKHQESLIKELLDQHIPKSLIQQVNNVITQLTAKDVFTIKQIIQETVSLQQCTSYNLLLQYLICKHFNMSLLNRNMNGLGEITPLKETDDYNIIDIRQNEDFLDFLKYEFLQLDPIPIAKFSQVSKPTFILQQVQAQHVEQTVDNTFFGGNVQEFKIGEMQDDSWSDELPKKKKKLKIKIKNAVENNQCVLQTLPELLKDGQHGQNAQGQTNDQIPEGDWGSW